MLKRYPPAMIFLALLGPAPLMGDELAPVLRLRPTHEELAARRAAEAGRDKPSAGLVELVEEGSVEKPRKPKVASLVSRSTVISFGDHWTIVPKGAVLHVPEALKSRVGTRPNGRLLTWADFFARNRGWMIGQPVEIGHARGEKELPEEVVTHFRKGSRVVVATCHNGPISMKQPTKLVSQPPSNTDENN